MNAYIYCADIYCEDCGRKIASNIGSVQYDLRQDSDYYPQGPYPDGGGEADCPQHCGCGADCVNAIELKDGWKIGAWLENPLTQYGVEYVREQIKRVEKLRNCGRNGIV